MDKLKKLIQQQLAISINKSMQKMCESVDKIIPRLHVNIKLYTPLEVSLVFAQSRPLLNDQLELSNLVLMAVQVAYYITLRIAF